MDKILRKSKSIAKAEFGEMSGVGYASVFGEIDRHGDFILPGAFLKSIPDFLENGTVNLSHWESLPIGIPTKAEEDDRGLRVEWEYHSTEDAIAAYTVAKERQAKGKSTGLSIGFRYAREDLVEFSNGMALSRWLKEHGYSDHDFNWAQIEGYDSRCWIIREVKELYEFSQVNTPANQLARTERIKSIFGGSSLSDVSADDHVEAVLSAVCGLTERMKEIASVRADEGKCPIGKKRLEHLDQLKSELDALISSAKSAMAPVIDEDLLRIQAEALLIY